MATLTKTKKTTTKTSTPKTTAVKTVKAEKKSHTLEDRINRMSGLKKKAEAARDNNVPFDYSNQGLKSSYDFLLQDLKTLRNEGPKAFLQTTGPDTTGRHRTKNDAYSDMKKLIDSLEEKQKKMSRPEPIPELKSKSEPMSSMPEQKPKRSWRDYLAGK